MVDPILVCVTHTIICSLNAAILLLCLAAVLYLACMGCWICISEVKLLRLQRVEKIETVHMPTPNSTLINVFEASDTV